MIVTVHRLGRVEYDDGLELQNQFQAARRENRVNDTLLLLEHPPVLTLGRAAEATNILTPRPVLDAMGVSVFETDRGGDVTYHGPGQLVGYPLLHLEPGRQDVRRYVRNIEEVIIRSLAEFSITATRIDKWPGVWVEESRLGGPRKICAVGVHLSRWYTRHGFALNVQPNLTHFELIVPCGISEAGVTSMGVELDRSVSVADVEPVVARHFADVFEATLEWAPRGRPTVAVAAVNDDGRVLVLKRSEARGGFWQVVTGSVEPGETTLAAARRELGEETGLTEVPVSALDYVHSFAVPNLRLTEEAGFVARVPTGALVTLSEEHSEFEWLKPEQAFERLPFAGLREVVKRGLRALAAHPTSS